MKQEFSTSWIGSKQPRKQRKYRVNAPLHIKGKLISSHLSETLKKRYGKRSFPLRKNDLVKVMRGEFKGKTGRIGDVNRRKMKVSVDGLNRGKKDGSKIAVYFDPSNLLIQGLNLEDRRRASSMASKVENKSKEKEENVHKKK